MKYFLPIVFLICLGSTAINAQEDPEFPRGFIMHLKLHDGVSGNLRKSPDLFIGGVQLVPQFTVVEHLLRAGIVADGFYTDKKIHGAFGPSVFIKLKTIQAGIFGSAGNIQLSLDHLWGTRKQRLAGLGVAADLGNLFIFGLAAHRDYQLKNWWIQTQLGIRVSRKKKVVEPFNQ